jgi:hypothetical protein
MGNHSTLFEKVFVLGQPVQLVCKLLCLACLACLASHERVHVTNCLSSFFSFALVASSRRLIPPSRLATFEATNCLGSLVAPEIQNYEF